MKVYHQLFWQIHNRKTNVGELSRTNYMGNILKKSISKYMQSNPLVLWMLDKIEPLFTTLVNSVKSYKKIIHWTIHKNWTYFN